MRYRYQFFQNFIDVLALHLRLRVQCPVSSVRILK